MSAGSGNHIPSLPHLAVNCPGGRSPTSHSNVTSNPSSVPTMSLTLPLAGGRGGVQASGVGATQMQIYS